MNKTQISKASKIFDGKVEPFPEREVPNADT